MARHVPPACPVGYEAKRGCRIYECPQTLIKDPFSKLIPPSAETSTVPPESSDFGFQSSEEAAILVAVFTFIGLLLLIAAVIGLLAKLRPQSLAWLKRKAASGWLAVVHFVRDVAPEALSSLQTRIFFARRRRYSSSCESSEGDREADSFDLMERELADFANANEHLKAKCQQQGSKQSSFGFRTVASGSELTETFESNSGNRGFNNLEAFCQARDRHLAEQLTSRQLYEKAGMLPKCPTSSSKFDPEAASTPRHVSFGTNQVHILTSDSSTKQSCNPLADDIGHESPDFANAVFEATLEGTSVEFYSTQQDKQASTQHFPNQSSSPSTQKLNDQPHLPDTDLYHWLDDEYAEERVRSFDAKDQRLAELERSGLLDDNGFMEADLAAEGEMEKGKEMETGSSLEGEVDLAAEEEMEKGKEMAGSSSGGENSEGSSGLLGDNKDREGGNFQSELSEKPTKRKRMTRAEAEFQKQLNLKNNPHNTRGKLKLKAAEKASKFYQFANDHLSESD